MTLLPDRYYAHENTSTIKCGNCWDADITKTATGDYSGDEAVYEKDLILQPENEPFQCDECLEQNEAYETGEW